MKPIPITETHGTPASEHAIDPYRVFFPLGVVAGLVGVGIWPLYAVGWISTIPSSIHVELQLQGFLFAFVLGFLMTALPRFSLTWHATWPELAWFSGLFLIGNVATAFGYFPIGRAAYLINMISLAIYAIRRFRKRKSDPPPEFVFVGAALLIGLFAATLRVAGLFGFMESGAEVFGRRLMSEGMMLMLVLGIGGKLAPMFFGFDATSPLISKMGEGVRFTRKHLAYLGIALVLLFSFVAEYAVSEKIGLWLRAIAATLIFLGTMKLHRRTKTKGVLVGVLKFSSWAVCLSLWGSAIHPRYRVEVLHVMFIGGFGMMILAIATRVILSHGNYPLDLERRSKSLFFAAFLLFGALICRAIAPLFVDAYFPLLGLAGTFWLFGLLLWGALFSTRTIVVRKK
ncbi:MAG TPA: NnrS family protein [Bdellovibrionota bacterium]|nr:NnrS family protein [Bdellovibrionota bacterium]